MAISAEDLIEIIGETRRARVALEGELEAVRKREGELVEELSSLRTEEEAFRANLARRFPNVDAEFDPSETGAGVANQGAWIDLARTAAVDLAVRQLTKEKGFATPADVETILLMNGRVETRDNIGAALSYLRVAGKIDRRDRGEWVAREP